MVEKTYYQIIGVPQNATDKDIKTAFRNKAKAMHPDKSTGSNEAFIELRKAYDTLINPLKRRDYDRSIQPQQPKQTPPPVNKTYENKWRPEPDIKWGTPKETTPEPKSETETVTNPVKPEKEYSIMFLAKVFIHIAVIVFFGSIELFTFLWMDMSFYLNQKVALSLNTVLSTSLTSLIIAAIVTYLAYTFEITSIIMFYRKVFGLKFAKLVVHILSKKPPRIRSLSLLNYASVGSIMVGAATILLTSYYGYNYNWVIVLAGLLILGGILAHMRIVFGLYFLYTLCFIMILFGFSFFLGGDIIIGMIIIGIACSFAYYVFNRRYWFY